MSMDVLRLRRLMGRTEWSAPAPWGDDGFLLRHKDGDGTIVVSETSLYDGTDWIHASMSRRGRVPSYDELCALHAAAFPGWAYHVFPPPDAKVNYHEYTLHLFGPSDGRPRLPDFTLGRGMV